MRHTKIVCTLGPASSHHDTVAAMVRAGMDVARLNTSHASLAEHVRLVQIVRQVSEEEGRPIAVLMDLAGPKLRTGATKAGLLINLLPGKTINLVRNLIDGTEEAVGIDYPRLTEDVRAGDRVLLDDGNIELEVERVTPEGLQCRVIYGGLLGPNKGVSFPNSNLTMPPITDRDREALAAGIQAGVDFFGLSFVREAADIKNARELINSLGADTPIIAKIERRQAIENLDEILAEADGAMVARGDLGVELNPEDVPVHQRRIIEAAGRNMIPVITATQMLESMVDSPRPTRAEASDVANAVWDLSDAVMLSQETAIGRYPVEAVAMMERIIRRAEASAAPEQRPMLQTDHDDHSFVIALATRSIVDSDPNMHGVVCFTRSGYSAFLLSKVHPHAPIYAITPNDSVCRRLSLARSVIPLYGPLVQSTEEMLSMVDRILLEQKHLSAGEEVVIVASLPVHSAATTNFLKLHTVGEATAD
ncbi:MAG TPA: pyruvate kinase [Tepidiformaceae bacterium]